MITRADMDETIMDATVKANKALIELMQEYTEPHAQALNGAAWQNMDPLKRAVVKQMAPADKFKQTEQQYGKKA